MDRGKDDGLNPGAPAPSSDATLDCRGLDCPLPIIHARVALARMRPGEVLRVLSTDPAIDRDFERFARLTSHEVTGIARRDEVYEVFVRRGD
ncbi:MAG: sulfurtransferase TusA family protein [Burkholderiaceae bacterium]